MSTQRNSKGSFPGHPAGANALRLRVVRGAILVLLFALAVAVAPARAQKKVDLFRLAVIGDSISAGFQNGGLLDSQQVHGYAVLIAGQARVPLPLPLIAPPGVPPVLELVSPGPPPVIVRASGTSPGRDNPLVQAFDLAVPGARVQDALTTRPSLPITPQNAWTDLVLGFPGLLAGISLSQVEWAETLRPTTIIVWIGNNDALGAVLSADLTKLTPVSQFKASYTELMNRLAATGATLVVANIPDVTVVPFLTSAEKVGAEVGLPLSVIGPLLGIGPGDFVLPDAFRLIQAVLAGQALGPLPDNLLLRANQVATIQATVDGYNAFIAQEAQTTGAALVDIHAVTSQIQSRGFVVGGQRLSTDFLDGIFSLDGVHPTNTGYAVIADEFIEVLNTSFAAGIPPLSVEQVAKTDPLVLPGVGRPASALGRISPDTMLSLRTILVH